MRVILPGSIVTLVGAFGCSETVQPTTLQCVQLASAPGVVVWISPVPNMRCVVPT